MSTINHFPRFCRPFAKLLIPETSPPRGPEIDAAVIGKAQDPLFFQASASGFLFVGYSLSAFSITFLELSHTWEFTPGRNRSLNYCKNIYYCKNI